MSWHELRWNGFSEKYILNKIKAQNFLYNSNITAYIVVCIVLKYKNLKVCVCGGVSVYLFLCGQVCVWTCKSDMNDSTCMHMFMWRPKINL